ncbi:MAG: tetratricopeptide repeat protein, partial [Planctomycetota bacterium]
MRRVLLVLVPALLIAAAFDMDVVETLKGKKYEGEIIKETDRYVRIRVKWPSGRTTVKRILKKDILAITKDGERRMINGPKGGPAAVKRSRKEVEELIDKIGKTPPEWWASAKLNYPKSLDFNWPDKPGGQWNNQRNVGQYVWDIVKPNPPRWHSGIKLMNHIMQVKKNDQRIVLKAMRTMGSLYYELLQDWARAAFWWRKASEKDGRQSNTPDLARCYWKLGNREMAEEILKGYTQDNSWNCQAGRLWCELGETDRGIQLAEARARQKPEQGYLAAGEFCFRDGRYKEALDYYQKALAAANRLPKAQG